MLQRAKAERSEGMGGMRWGRILAAGWLVCAGCGVTDDNALPPDVQDPANLKTPAGAMSYYRGVLKAPLAGALNDAIHASAILTDELVALPVALGQAGLETIVDSRHNTQNLSLHAYPSFHTLRTQARDARAHLAAYLPDSSPALQGHLYAAEGYAELFLADLFCSGIPLSTVDFEGDYTLAAGSTTTEVYTHSAALFDSALALASDSARVQQLASVGRGRALLALGQYAAAAEAVTGVLDGFAYQVVSDSAKFLVNLSYSGSSPGLISMGDAEGINGLNYRSSSDLRTLARSMGTDLRGNQAFLPSKYLPTSTNPATLTYTVASGIEARLIEAEAALRVGDTVTWRAKLNHLRQNAWSSIVPAVSAPMDTLADPGFDTDGDDDRRINLQFRERAFWLYMTGHRQGDLRRLIRQYGRAQDAVYPTGSYPGYQGVYGTEIVVMVPEQERITNPLYTGCFNRDA